MQKYNLLNYLFPNTPWKLPTIPLSREEALAMHLVPLSLACNTEELWIIHNMAMDCKRLHLNYAFVQEVDGISIYKATYTKQTHDQTKG
jgi:hypothetical protein